MKKFGFTLAEVLITLAILGVVAAIAVPALMTNIHNQANASKLSSVVTDLENAFGMMIVDDDDANDLTDIDFYNGVHWQTSNDIQTELGRYLKIVSCNAGLGNYYGDGSMHNIDGSDAAPEIGATCQLKNGAFLLFIGGISNANEAVAQALGINVVRGKRLLIDVNGADKPNRYGRDIFSFFVDENGSLDPFGGRIAAVLRINDATQIWSDPDTADNDFICTDANKGNGLGCTARLIENNYRVDY